MAAGADFTLVPSVVEILEPVYNNVTSQSESMKKEYINIAATPMERYRLSFKALSSTDMATLRTHFKDNSGDYYPFTWKSVPSYVDAGANKTGRWVAGTLKISPNAELYWSCEVTFETQV